MISCFADCVILLFYGLGFSETDLSLSEKKTGT